MRHLTSGILCLGLAGSLAVGVVSLVPGGPGDRRLGLWNLQAVRDETERGERLDEEVGAALRRLTAKERALQDLLAGRRTLLATAARFRDSDAGVTADYRDVWRFTTPGHSDDERYCRQVLLFAAVELRDRPDGPAVLGRLRAPLDEALARGDLRLPD
jgi:hypothetical protein